MGFPGHLARGAHLGLNESLPESRESSSLVKSLSAGTLRVALLTQKSNLFKLI